MTIRPGEEWGVTVDRPAGLRLAATDRELARLTSLDPTEPIAAGGGDLHRSLGAPRVRSAMQLVPVDLLRVVADGVEHRAVAHAVARRGWWRGRIVAVMNVDHLGDWNVAPRAHPNDGRFDVVEVARAMGFRARWQARSRLPGGTHVPHPGITTRTARSADWEFEQPLELWLDGERVGAVRELCVELVPDAYDLHV